MNTVVVVGSEPLDYPGGMETFCRILISILREEGFQTHYVSASQLLRPSLLDRVPTRRRNLRGLWRPIAAAVAVARRVMRKPPDIVVTNGPLGWGIRGRRLSVHCYHGTYVGYADALRDLLHPIGRLLLRWRDGMFLERMAGYGKTCVANSELVTNEVKRYFGYSASAVGLPIDVSRFSPGAKDHLLIETLGLQEGWPIGFFAGAGRPIKGEQTAYAVIRSLPETQWIIIGDPSAVPPDLRRWARRPVAPEQMPALLRSVDWVLAPSLYESFSFLVAEALACGTPVIALGAVGSASLLLSSSPLSEWIVPDPRDVRAYVEKVRHVLKDPERARMLAMEARTRVVEWLAPKVWRKRFLEYTGLANFIP